MTIHVAVVGAGPSGFYTAQSLISSGADIAVDIIETLPAPHGLIRSGVAPDHQHTKRVTRTYDETAAESTVRFFGNVTIGKDLSLAELREIYDAVILATGAPHDRALEIIGGPKKGVYGAAEFVGWYNGHPDHADLAPLLDTTAVAVIGNGNVALDIGRVLTKTPDEMQATDLATHAAEAIHDSPITDVYILGRRGPIEAKFTNVELREIERLADCVPIVDAAQIPDGVPEDAAMSDRDRRLTERNLATFRTCAAMSAEGKSKRLHFRFYTRPVEILGDERVAGLRVEKTRLEGDWFIGTGEFEDLPVGMLVAAIGYKSRPIEGAPIDEKKGVIANAEGRIEPGLYVVGWAKRGPSGVISSNKPDGEQAAKLVLADVADGGKPGRPALERLLVERGVSWVTYEDWQTIDAAEVAGAPEGAPRRKFVRVEDMLSVVGKDGA